MSTDEDLNGNGFEPEGDGQFRRLALVAALVSAVAIILTVSLLFWLTMQGLNRNTELETENDYLKVQVAELQADKDKLTAHALGLTGIIEALSGAGNHTEAPPLPTSTTTTTVPMPDDPIHGNLPPGLPNPHGDSND